MELKDAFRSNIAKESSHCIICNDEVKSGTRVIEGEYRIGGKVIGKTVRAAACLGCAQDLVDVLGARIKEARAL